MLDWLNSCFPKARKIRVFIRISPLHVNKACFDKAEICVIDQQTLVWSRSVRVYTDSGLSFVSALCAEDDGCRWSIRRDFLVS